eukprot:55852-Eustigmatos_ZCMA.PRE.1
MPSRFWLSSGYVSRAVLLRTCWPAKPAESTNGLYLSVSTVQGGFKVGRKKPVPPPPTFVSQIMGT